MSESILKYPKTVENLTKNVEKWAKMSKNNQNTVKNVEKITKMTKNL